VVLEVPERQVKAPLLAALVEVVGTGGWISLEYNSADGVNTRTIRPDRLYADRGLWYLVGFDGRISRTMRVDRVRSLAVTDAPEVVEDPVPYDHPSHPLIRVRINRRAARIVEREPHMGIHIDASLEEQHLEFRCPPSELDWYANYFGGLGADAEVLEPEELRAGIRARAQTLLGLYRENS